MNNIQPRLMRGEKAFLSLFRLSSSGGKVINHHKDKDPFLCDAKSLHAGLSAGDILFGYYMQGREAHVITGQQTWMDVEAKFRALQAERNGDLLRTRIG